MQSSNFKPVWEVLNALKAHDEVLAFELDQYRTDMGRGSIANGSSSGLSKIVFDLPAAIDESFADSLTTLLVEKTTSSWDFWFGLLQVFVQKNGHARVSGRYKTENNYQLGAWVGNQRINNNEISVGRKSKLESLDGWAWDALSFNWEHGVSQLEVYVSQFGHARVPGDYKTEDGFNLGGWIAGKRKVKMKLISVQKEKLESLSGWTWDVLDFKWEQGFSYLEKFVQEEGHARVSSVNTIIDGFSLSNWINRQRSNKDQLSKEKQSRLESLDGWRWDLITLSWERGMSHLESYIKQHSNSMVPSRHESSDGFKLGHWVGRQRKMKEQLTTEKISNLESLSGWIWDMFEYQWEQGFFYLEKFVQEEGHARVSLRYKNSEGFLLGSWVRNQRTKKDQLSIELISRLESLDGWVWDALEFQWEQGFSYLEQYIQEFGDAKVLADYQTEDGYKLGNWVRSQKANKQPLTPERASKLKILFE